MAMNVEEVRKLDTKYTDYEAQGFHFWNSYDAKYEVDQAIRNLKRWGNQIRVIKYPNGVYVVMRKEGGRDTYDRAIATDKTRGRKEFEV